MKYVPLTKERLDSILELWNQEIGGYFPMRKKLLEQNSLLDQNVLQAGSWVSIDETTNQVNGFIVAKTGQEEKTGPNLGDDIGWIQIIVVASPYRNQGIGTALLQRAENAFQAEGVKKIVLGRDPWHYFPGIPDKLSSSRSWFERRGYTYSNQVHDLFRDLGEEKIELPQKSGVSFRLLQKEEKDELLSFFQRCFPGRWEYEALKYFEYGGTGREFVVLELDKKIIGFCRINDHQSPIIAQNVYWSGRYQDHLGGIGPLGIDQQYRKNGYGLALVQAGMYFLNSRGIKKLVIDWTELVAFYEKLHFSVCDTFYQYDKQL